jgi:imidazolonepropionase-like amidohydrolase
LPGLIDAHCHISLHQGALPGVKYTSTAEFCTLWAAHAIGQVLCAGVTSIAVPGGKWFTDVTVREAVEGGLLEGPRMVVAGRALSNYGGIFDPDPYPAFEGIPADTAGVLCITRDEFIRETRKQCKRGVDLIKIADSTWGDVQTVADDEIAAVVDEAHRHNGAPRSRLGPDVVLVAQNTGIVPAQVFELQSNRALLRRHRLRR